MCVKVTHSNECTAPGSLTSRLNLWKESEHGVEAAEQVHCDIDSNRKFTAL
jgi:hypothetical protein